MSESKCSIVVGGGVKIEVRHGDLTVEPVDAIVNAANGRLDHASGLAGAIIKAGGRSIQAESDDLFERNGKLEEGSDICVSFAYHGVF